MKRKTMMAWAMAALLGLSACGGGSAPQKSPDTQPTAQETTPAEQPAAPEESPAPEIDPIRVLTLKGPTGMGLAGLMKQSQAGTAAQAYDFQLAGAPDQAVAALTSGEVDIAAIPSNLAATLYQKTKGAIQVMAVNTLNNLYILSTEDEVQSIADLAGRTLHATGQGAVPEYVINYLLAANGVTDCTIEWHSEHAELAALMSSGDVTLGLLPEPHVEVALAKNENLKLAVDMNAEWNAKQPQTPMAIGCIAVRTAYAAEHPAELDTFLNEYASSVHDVNADPAQAGEWIAAFGILDNAAVAAAAIPQCNIVMIGPMGEAGEPTMQSILPAFYQVLMEANPQSIGGALPGADFYYGVAPEEGQDALKQPENADTTDGESPEPQEDTPAEPQDAAA